MPHYTLYYFNARGRAEICRFLFAAADVAFTDKRIPFSDWNEWKIKMPGSMMPVLEIDAKQKWPQTMAIARFLAREFGFYPKVNLEMAKVDYICDCFYEILCEWLRWYYEKDIPKKTEWEHSFQESCRRILPFMEKTLEANSGGNGWFVGNQIYVCDMMCYTAMENPLRENPNMLDRFPKLLALRNRVAVHPKLTEYLKKRVAADF